MCWKAIVLQQGLEPNISEISLKGSIYNKMERSNGELRDAYSIYGFPWCPPPGEDELA